MQTTISVNISIDELSELIANSIKEAIRTERPPTDDKPDELIKIDEVAKIFGVSKVTIFAWKKAGKIPFYRISRKVFFKRSEVLEALNKIGGK